MNNEYLTVTQINKYIKYKFDNDENLNLVYLKGEISNFKNHSTGHLYFTIKDETSRIMAVMFRNNASKIKFNPVDGSKVLVVGRVGVYEANGNYQIYVEEMLEDGVGNLAIEFEKLKKKLSEKGYFDDKYKKPIPKFPKKIGIITATTGAAIRDIITTINRRYRNVELDIFPCLVQGVDAKNDIVRNLKIANNFDLDLIILGRGGGSIEDLWAFNEEIVAEAVFKSKIPIISAVGHEIDFTISDFVADLRAPTPTAAAELAVPNTIELITYINQLNIRKNKSILNIINKKREKLDALKTSYILKNPQSIYEVKAQKIDNLIEKLIYVTSSKITNNKNILDNLNNKKDVLIKNILDKKTNRYLNILNKLEPLNPILTIKRGYTITKKDDKSLSSIKDVFENDLIKTTLNDGIITSKVISMEEM
ncbi:MAG: exodeoxyribonuclease VII large subunit [bacterium]|nr:exodeoxyribonuclease VII large subunit [bacterium]